MRVAPRGLLHCRTRQLLSLSEGHCFAALLFLIDDFCGALQPSCLPLMHCRGMLLCVPQSPQHTPRLAAALENSSLCGRPAPASGSPVGAHCAASPRIADAARHAILRITEVQRRVAAPFQGLHACLRILRPLDLRVMPATRAPAATTPSGRAAGPRSSALGACSLRVLVDRADCFSVAAQKVQPLLAGM